MDANKYCKCVSGFPRLKKRLYIRKNVPIFSKTKTKYTWRGHVPMVESYKRSFVPIGYICEYCGEIMADDNKKYVPFDKYHVLEFDYKQLRDNINKISLEE
ncbi:unnamed protein product [marine sediment metagenome]|uniref:Uncharacterized protein n=1 Tax=marine sediment metagenome TaxID=412755 RepID=X1QEZ0_9ZZZZ